MFSPRWKAAELSKFSAIETAFRKTIAFGNAKVVLHKLLQDELCVDGHVMLLTLEKLGHLRDRVVPDVVNAIGLSRALDAEKSNSRSAFENFDSAHRTLEASLKETVAELSFVDHFVRWSSLRALVDQFRNTHDELTILAKDRLRFPLDAGTQLKALSTSFARDQCKSLLRGAERLAWLIDNRLHGSAVESHALRRLHSYFEHFAKRQIVADLQHEKKEAKGNRRYEDIIQGYVDRFLFSEGLYPVTHAEASGGKIDTFVIDNISLFREIRATHQIPVLLELKQLVCTNYSADFKSELKSKVTSALHQAQIYSAHLRSNLAWHDHHVTGVVVYDGAKRFQTAVEGVRLIYLGTAIPSDGFTPLD